MASSSSKEDGAAKEDTSFSMRMCLTGIRAKFPSVSNISTKSLHQLIEEHSGKLLMLDCRDECEYNVSHIENARRVDGDGKDLAETVEYIQQNFSCQLQIICYCSLGYRSSRYAQLLEDKFKDVPTYKVYNLEGSLFKWANEDRPIVNVQKEAVLKVHPYNAVFGKLLRKDLRHDV